MREEKRRDEGRIDISQGVSVWRSQIAFTSQKNKSRAQVIKNRNRVHTLLPCIDILEKVTDIGAWGVSIRKVQVL